MTHETDHPAFSRGLENPVGKLLNELGTKVDFDTDKKFREMMNEAGTTPAGAIRDFVFKVVHGETFTDMCIREANAKRDKMLSTGLDEALKGARK